LARRWKRLDPAGQKTFPSRARHPQPDGAEPGYEIALIVAIPIGLPQAAPPLVQLAHRIAIPLPPRIRLQQLLPHHRRLPVHIAPETLFHLRQKMLKMLRD